MWFANAGIPWGFKDHFCNELEAYAAEKPGMSPKELCARVCALDARVKDNYNGFRKPCVDDCVTNIFPKCRGGYYRR